MGNIILKSFRELAKASIFKQQTPWEKEYRRAKSRAVMERVKARQPKTEIPYKLPKPPKITPGRMGELYSKYEGTTPDLAVLPRVTKQGPPRLGLVPQSGDPQHPYRWVRPKEDTSRRADMMTAVPEKQPATSKYKLGTHEETVNAARKKIFDMQSEFQRAMFWVEDSGHPEILDEMREADKLLDKIRRMLFEAKPTD